ncbi:MAG: D-alanyl-D-alanine carboxypeptidase [Lachnospiraceae bacterium]|jgi:D-alanyl-D-alanine carboxypeptidase (penicillin-binding protein 5/6)|nr:D-alanyl-D-alanine carboxypeptidase [Lachnospiraceae bacterium]
MLKIFRYRSIYLITAILTGILLGNSSLTASASSDAELRLETHRAMDIQSNEIQNWPTGPVVGAESAILMEAETGTILYSKNIHQQQYPASTTKILTALIASERCGMDEIVTFSNDAVFDTPRDSSHIAMNPGEELTMEQSLNAILIRSANEVCYAVAEHITGTTDWQVFSDIMNERASELGCLNSHFVNPNGLPDENHYTTAYDLAMIGRVFFANEMLCKITLSKRIDFPVTEKLPKGKLENNIMKIIPGGEYAYEYLVGCKTGYTDIARSCLVSCAEKEGMKLICVVMHDESPYQYQDTIALFDYGFSNFEKINVSKTETKYNIDNTGLFYSGNDLFGSSQPFLSLNQDDFIIMPRTASFDDAKSSISYDTGNENQAAIISYTYHDIPVGSVRVNFSVNREENSLFDIQPDGEVLPQESDQPVIFVNVALILIGLGVLVGIVLVWLLIRSILKNYSFGGRSNRRKRKNRRKQRSAGGYRDIDF